MWFPACRRHVTRHGRGPTLVCALKVDHTTRTVTPTADCTDAVSVECTDCEQESCIAAAQWAHAQARTLWPDVVNGVQRHLLRGTAWTMDPWIALPTRDECYTHSGVQMVHSVPWPCLMHRTSLGHTRFPVPSIIIALCRSLRPHEWPLAS